MYLTLRNQNFRIYTYIKYFLNILSLRLFLQHEFLYAGNYLDLHEIVNLLITVDLFTFMWRIGLTN